MQLKGIPQGTITRLQKLFGASLAMMIVGVFAVQMKTAAGAMLAGSVSISGGVIFLLLALQEWRAERRAK